MKTKNNFSSIISLHKKNIRQKDLEEYTPVTSFYKKRKLFIVVNVDWFFLSHRLPIALAAKQNGYDVSIITKDTGKRTEIENYQLKFINIDFERSGFNIFHELKCICQLYKIYFLDHPDIIHHVTLKASLLGCIAAKFAWKKNVVNAISGFGYNFTDGRKGLKQMVLLQVLKFAFKPKRFHFILQNPDDIRELNKNLSLKENRIHLIKGSGVDLTHFDFTEEVKGEKLKVVLPARMLYDKGVIEFIGAAYLIKEKIYNKAEFILAGDCDKNNLAGIPEQELLTHIDQDYIKWVGFQQNIIDLLKSAHIIVLPSYREGLPKALIEACAIGRPIVTTDTNGCRECVEDNRNGYLVPVKNVQKLAEKILLLIESKKLRTEMGLASRSIAEKEFSLENVIQDHLRIYENLIK